MTDIVPLSVMEEAHGIVNGARAQAYGHPQENFDRICNLWNAYLGGRACGLGDLITAKDHAIMMMLLKIARLQETPDHRDSLVDICGYAGTYEKLVAREQARAAEMEEMYSQLAANLAEYQEPPLENLPLGSVISTGRGPSMSGFQADGRIYWFRHEDGWKCAPDAAAYPDDYLTRVWGEHRVVQWG